MYFAICLPCPSHLRIHAHVIDRESVSTTFHCPPCCRLPIEVVAATVCSNNCKFVLDPLSPITSLDQLWTQAILLRGFLLPKVLDLAGRFGGVFPVWDEECLFEGCADRDWVSYKGRLRMGAIKNPERGIEKVDSAYGGDVSRLLDVCRETIVFESLEKLADCLQVR